MHWQGCIGTENVLLRIFDRSYLKNKDSVDDFLDALGFNEIPSGLQRIPKEMNSRLPDALLPFLLPPLLPKGLSPKRSRELNAIGISAFDARQMSKAGDEATLAALCEEVERLGELLPEYKKLYERQEISLDYPELNVDPTQKFICSLLYHIWNEVRDLKQMLTPPVPPEDI
jgi:hypothetical protein